MNENWATGDLTKKIHTNLDMGTRAPEEELRNKQKSASKEAVEEAVVWVDDGEDEEEAHVALELVGKIWTERHINANAFMAIMKTVWQRSMELTLVVLGTTPLSSNSTIGETNKGLWKDNLGILTTTPFFLVI